MDDQITNVIMNLTSLEKQFLVIDFRKHIGKVEYQMEPHIGERKCHGAKDDPTQWTNTGINEVNPVMLKLQDIGFNLLQETNDKKTFRFYLPILIVMFNQFAKISPYDRALRQEFMKGTIDQLTGYTLKIWTHTLETEVLMESLPNYCCLQALAHRHSVMLISHILDDSTSFEIMSMVTDNRIINDMTNVNSSNQMFNGNIIYNHTKMCIAHGTIELLLVRLTCFEAYYEENGLEINPSKLSYALSKEKSFKHTDKGVEIGELINFLTSCEDHRAKSCYTRPSLCIIVAHHKGCKQHGFGLFNHSKDLKDHDVFKPCGPIERIDDERSATIVKLTSDETMTQNLKKIEMDPPRLIAINLDIHNSELNTKVTTYVYSRCNISVILYKNMNYIPRNYLSGTNLPVEAITLWHGILTTISEVISKYQKYMINQERQQIKRFHDKLRMYLRIHETAITMTKAHWEQ